MEEFRAEKTKGPQRVFCEICAEFIYGGEEELDHVSLFKMKLIANRNILIKHFLKIEFKHIGLYMKQLLFNQTILLQYSI